MINWPVFFAVAAVLLLGRLFSDSAGEDGWDWFAGCLLSIVSLL